MAATDKTRQFENYLRKRCAIKQQFLDIIEHGQLADLQQYLDQCSQNIKLRHLLNYEFKHGKRLLHVAVRKLELMKYLLQLKPDLIHSIDWASNTVLHEAVYAVAPIENIRYIIECKPELLTTLNAYEDSPLHLAVQERRVDIATILFRAAPQMLEVVDDVGKTPLDYARHETCTECKYCQKINDASPTSAIINDTSHKTCPDGQCQSCPGEHIEMIQLLDPMTKGAYVSKNEIEGTLWAL